MPAVLHILDAACGETQLHRLLALHDALPDRQSAHSLLSLDGPAANRAARFLGFAVPALPRRLPPLKWAPGLRTSVDNAALAILHAWGVEAAGVCASQLPDLPLVLTLLRPEVLPHAARWIRSFPTDATVIVDSQTARAALIASGIVPERVVVIRFPADFAAINQARSQDLRRDVVGDASPVLLMPGPPSRAGGQYFGLWAAAIVKQIHRRLRVLMPYDSPESRRLGRFVRQIGMPDLLAVPNARLTYPQLAACADLFLVPAAEETCVDPIAVALAAGLPVVGAAVRSVAELIADHQTGLLCKPRQPRRLAARILTAIEDHGLRRRLADAARAHAYESLSPHAFIENHERLYDNILRGRLPADGIRDPLIAA